MGGTRPQAALENLGLTTMESLPPRRQPRRLIQLKCICATKDFLAHILRNGIGGGFSAALLVGHVCDHSDRLRQLVGGLPQRLVLRGDGDAQLAGTNTCELENFQDRRCRGAGSIPDSAFPIWQASYIGNASELTNRNSRGLNKKQD